MSGTLILLVASACNSEMGQIDTIGTSTTGSTTTTSVAPTTETSSSPDVESGTRTVDCEAAIYFYDHRPEDWVDVPPIKILDPENSLGLFNDEHFADVDINSVETFKYVLLANGSTSGHVEVGVATEDQDWARLRYRSEPGNSILIPFEEADIAVRFEPCPDRDTQFRGGLVLLSTGCLDLIITPDQSSAETYTLAVGDHDCDTQAA